MTAVLIPCAAEHHFRDAICSYGIARLLVRCCQRLARGEMAPGDKDEKPLPQVHTTAVQHTPSGQSKAL